MKTNGRVAICIGCVLIGGVGVAWSMVRETRLERQMVVLKARAKKFDDFCEQQRTFLELVEDHLQRGSNRQDSERQEFAEVFVDQSGKRELIACLGGAVWDFERADVCEDPKCMIEVIDQTIALLSKAIGDKL